MSFECGQYGQFVPGEQILHGEAEKSFCLRKAEKTEKFCHCMFQKCQTACAGG